MTSDPCNPYQTPSISLEGKKSQSVGAAPSVILLVAVFLTLLVISLCTIAIAMLRQRQYLPFPPGIYCMALIGLYSLAWCIYSARNTKSLTFKHGLTQTIVLVAWATTFATACIFTGRLFSLGDQQTFALVYSVSALIVAAIVQLIHHFVTMGLRSQGEASQYS